MPSDIDTHEFDDLVAALREERPRIDPSFARELDARAAGGFPKPRRRFRLPQISVGMQASAVGLAAVAAVVVTAGVISSSETTSSDSDGGSAATSAARPSQAAKTAPDMTLRSPASGAAAPAPGSLGGRLQEQSASVTLVAPAGDVAEVGDRILGVADQVGGFVVSSDVRATDGTSGGGDFSLRVPADRLDDALARLSRLAHVQSRQQGIEDITAQRNVARDRLLEASAERRSLLGRLAEADSDNEVASLRARLRDVSTAIAAARAELQRVVRRGRFATVAVTLTAKQGGAVAPPDDGKWTPGDAVRDALRVLEVATGVLLLLGAVVAPLALVAAAALAARRVAGHRGRERVLDAV